MNMENILNLRPWERLPNESIKSYIYFIAYKDLGFQRTVEKVQIKCELKSSSYLEKCCAKYNWVERAEKYDQHILNTSTEILEKQHADQLVNINLQHAEYINLAIENLVIVLEEFKNRIHKNPKLLEELTLKELLSYIIKCNKPLMENIKLTREIYGLDDNVNINIENKKSTKSIEELEHEKFLETQKELATILIGSFGSDKIIEALTKIENDND